MKTKTKTKNLKQSRTMKLNDNFDPENEYNNFICAHCGCKGTINDFDFVEATQNHDDYMICPECDEITDL